MATRKPLVAVDGLATELPAGDVVYGDDGAVFAVAGFTSPSGDYPGATAWSALDREPLWWDGARWLDAEQASADFRQRMFGIDAQGGTTFQARGITLTNAGTLTARLPSSTGNITNRRRRTGLVSAATTGSFASSRGGQLPLNLGNTSGSFQLGGFDWAAEFVIADAAAVSGARQFVGVANSSAAPTNVEPATLINCFGIGHGAADSTLRIYYGGTNAQTPIDLGANFPTALGNGYRLRLINTPGQPGGNQAVAYEVVNLNTGQSAAGTLTGVSGTVMPTNTIQLNPWWCYRTNNATALAVGLDIIGMRCRDLSQYP